MAEQTDPNIDVAALDAWLDDVWARGNTPDWAGGYEATTDGEPAAPIPDFRRKV